MLAFDCTYLTQSLCSMELHGAKAMVGGTWTQENPNNSFLELKEDTDIGNVRKSASMCEFLLWSMSSKRKTPISVASVPVEHNFSGPMSGYRGNMYMCNLLGLVMEQNDSLVKAVVCDSASTHQYIRKLLFGQCDTLPMEDIMELPFWRGLQWKDLPTHCLPRLPVRICYSGGEPLWQVPGVCLLVGDVSNLLWLL